MANKTAFPTVIDTVFMGKEREQGNFQDDDGVQVTYGEKFLFAFESSDGLAQTVSITDKRLEEVGVKPAELKKLQPLRIVGDVVVSDRGGYLKPTEVQRASS